MGRRTLYDTTCPRQQVPEHLGEKQGLYRDNSGIIRDISGIFQGYFRGKTPLWRPVSTVDRGNFGEKCPKWRLITSMFGYFLPGTSRGQIKVGADFVKEIWDE